MLAKILQWFSYKLKDAPKDQYLYDSNGEITTAPPPKPHSDRLALLYRLTQTFNSILDLDEVLNTVMDEVISAIHAERGFIVLVEEDAPMDFRAARGMEQTSIDDPQLQVSRSVVERVARQGEPISTMDAQKDERLMGSGSVMIKGLRSILCVPLKIKERVRGVVYVDNRMKVGMFTGEDLDLLTAIASSAAVAIENARLYRMAVDKGRLERELQMARELQSGLLPHEPPHIPGWEFASRWEPAQQVAGDYFDFIRGNDEEVDIVIADVSGKGMPAALFMADTRSVIRAGMGSFPSPAENIAYANRVLCADSIGGTFVTLFYNRVNTNNGDVIYVNAGHNPPLRYHSAEGRLTQLERTGIPLGVEEDMPYEQKTIHLEPGDLILLYTDGVTDATNEALQSFGIERLERVVLENGQAPLAEMMSALEQEIQSFMGTAEQFDDIAVVGIKRLQ